LIKLLLNITVIRERLLLRQPCEILLRSKGFAFISQGQLGGSQLFSAFSMAKKGYVYIAANLNNSVLNTGVTICLRNQLILRTTNHYKLQTPVKYAPSPVKYFRASNFTG